MLSYCDLSLYEYYLTVTYHFTQALMVPAGPCPETSTCWFVSASGDWYLLVRVRRLVPAGPCPRTGTCRSVSEDWYLLVRVWTCWFVTGTCWSVSKDWYLQVRLVPAGSCPWTGACWSTSGDWYLLVRVRELVNAGSYSITDTWRWWSGDWSLERWSCETSWGSDRGPAISDDSQFPPAYRGTA